MRKFLLGVLLLPALAFSAEPVEVNKKVVCDDAKTMLQHFATKYEELPIWMGQTEPATFVVMVNVETQTWSFVQFNKDIACLIDQGVGFKFKLPEPKSTL